MKANHKFLEMLLTMKQANDNALTDHYIHTAAKVITTNSFLPIARMHGDHIPTLLDVFPQAVHDLPWLSGFARRPPAYMVAPLQEVEDVDTWKQLLEVCAPQ